MSVTRWQKPSISSLQIGRINAVRAAAPRIPRALQGCRPRSCDLPIRVPSFYSLHAHPTPRQHALANPCSDTPGAHLGPRRPGCQLHNLPLHLVEKSLCSSPAPPSRPASFPTSPQPTQAVLSALTPAPRALSSSVPRQIANCLSVLSFPPAGCPTPASTRPSSWAA